MNSGQEHKIEFVVEGQNLTLKIHDPINEKRTLRNQGDLYKYLNTGSNDEPIYIGGVPNSIKERISKQLLHVKNSTSLSGCLSDLFINSKPRNLLNTEYSHKIGAGCAFKEACYEDEQSTATNRKCHNGGRCVSKFSLDADYTCECLSNFTGTHCETSIRATNGLQYRAVPLMASSSKHTSRTSKHVSQNGTCHEKVNFEIYVDSNTGCKSRKKIRTVTCEGACTGQDSALDQFQLLDKNAQFSYLIGTNKKRDAQTRDSQSADVCCQATRTKAKPFRLFCADGSSYLHDVNMVKKCSCTSRRQR